MHDADAPLLLSHTVAAVDGMAPIDERPANASGDDDPRCERPEDANEVAALLAVLRGEENMRVVDAKIRSPGCKQAEP